MPQLRGLLFGGGLALYCVSPLAEAQEMPPPAPSEPASAQDLANVRAELARQSAELERQRAELAALAQPQEPPPGPSLRFSGYAQVDLVLHNQASQNEIDYATNAPLNQDRFTLRRGHLRVDAAEGLISGALEIDANTTNGAQVRPIDAEVAVHWPEHPNDRLPSISVSAGLMKIPFGFEVPELDYVRPFLERSSVARALFPGEFDLGARIHGQYRFLDVALALMNGHPIGDRVFPALAPDAHKEFVCRVGTHTEIVPGLALDLGVSADTGHGFHEGTPSTKDVLIWRDDNGDGVVQATEVQVIPGSSATASQEFSRFAVGADARVGVHLRHGYGFDVRAEIVRASNLDRGLEPADPVGAGHDLRELGWSLGATQEITEFGLIGLRYDRYDPDQDAREQSAAQVVPRDRSYSTLALLAMLRYGRARLSFEYDLNRNELGRDASGAPTNLKSDAATLRGQVVF